MEFGELLLCLHHFRCNTVDNNNHLHSHVLLFPPCFATLLSAVAVLLLVTTVGQTAMTDDLQTTPTPALSNSVLTTELINSSVEEVRVLRSHRSCGSEYANYCENGGTCIYPQDTNKPFCNCTPPYKGHRCLFFDVTDNTRTKPEVEQLIAIGFGVAMFILVLAAITCCFVYKRCIKSAKLIKFAPESA
ncbi:epigen-like [Chaetodon trifascialis]|uniref:epigen-like n=1 Tax=Chaetodon trifascialis TaxID=109706 RepID=UPI0039935C42